MKIILATILGSYSSIDAEQLNGGELEKNLLDSIKRLKPLKAKTRVQIL